MQNHVLLGRYEHYSGKMYEVVGVARHSEPLEEHVVYRGLYRSEEFARKPCFWKM